MVFNSFAFSFFYLVRTHMLRPNHFTIIIFKDLGGLSYSFEISTVVVFEIFDLDFLFMYFVIFVLKFK